MQSEHMRAALCDGARLAHPNPITLTLPLTLPLTLTLTLTLNLVTLTLTLTLTGDAALCDGARLGAHTGRGQNPRFVQASPALLDPSSGPDHPHHPPCP